MYSKHIWHIWIGLGLLILAGCNTPVRPEVDGLVCASAGRSVDLLPGEAVTEDFHMPQGKSISSSSKSALHQDKVVDAGFDNFLLISAQQAIKEGEQPKGIPSLLERLQSPARATRAARSCRSSFPTPEKYRRQR